MVFLFPYQSALSLHMHIEILFYLGLNCGGGISKERKAFLVTTLSYEILCPEELEFCVFFLGRHLFFKQFKFQKKECSAFSACSKKTPPLMVSYFHLTWALNLNSVSHPERCIKKKGHFVFPGLQ